MKEKFHEALTFAAKMWEKETGYPSYLLVGPDGVRHGLPDEMFHPLNEVARGIAGFTEEETTPLENFLDKDVAEKVVDHALEIITENDISPNKQAVIFLVVREGWPLGYSVEYVSNYIYIHGKPPNWMITENSSTKLK